ncbi:MAG: plasmid recombination protein [Paraclostridium sp.]
MTTISFHTDKTTSISHNNRTNIYGNKDIDLSKLSSNIYYIKKDIKDFYAEEFSEAVNEYNLNQKRSDRKINDYYKKILNDKKTEHQRELIVSIGGKEENISDEIINNKRNILDEYMKNFQKRNPNLKVYNAVMHLDEANPHLHINYVPVANYTRGLKKRVSHENALKEQGVSFKEWRDSETNFIEAIMNQKGLERGFKGSHKHMSVKEYKELKIEMNALKSEITILKQKKFIIDKELSEIILCAKHLNSCDLSGLYVHIKDVNSSSPRINSLNDRLYLYEDFKDIAEKLNDLSLNQNCKSKIKIDIYDETSLGEVTKLLRGFEFKIGDEYSVNLDYKVLSSLGPLVHSKYDRIANINHIELTR